MAEFRLTKKEETDLKEQFERWKTIMNWRIAPLAFAAVIAAIPVEKYRIVICCLGLSVITGAYIVARNEFPKVFSGLQSKQNRTFREEIIFKGVSSYYFGLTSMIKHFAPFLCSVMPLIFVLFGGIERLGL
jgi:hypothetical protein